MEPTTKYDNCSCCLIKPHAVRDGHAGDIVNAIRKEGFQITDIRFVSILEFMIEPILSCFVLKVLFFSCDKRTKAHFHSARGSIDYCSGSDMKYPKGSIAGPAVFIPFTIMPAIRSKLQLCLEMARTLMTLFVNPRSQTISFLMRKPLILQA